MFTQKRKRFYGLRYAVAGMTILALLAVASLAAATGGQGVGTYSGDDAYDPAAGGRPELSLNGGPRLSAGTSYSGDDAYDPAAGGRPGLWLFAHAVDVTPSVRCGLPAAEIARRSAMAIAGGFGGDDAYDPAAGGTPELSLLTFADVPSLAAVCEITAE